MLGPSFGEEEFSAGLLKIPWSEVCAIVCAGPSHSTKINGLVLLMDFPHFYPFMKERTNKPQMAIVKRQKHWKLTAFYLIRVFIFYRVRKRT